MRLYNVPGQGKLLEALGLYLELTDNMPWLQEKKGAGNSKGGDIMGRDTKAKVSQMVENKQL